MPDRSLYLPSHPFLFFFPLLYLWPSKITTQNIRQQSADHKFSSDSFDSGGAHFLGIHLISKWHQMIKEHIWVFELPIKIVHYWAQIWSTITSWSNLKRMSSQYWQVITSCLSSSSSLFFFFLMYLINKNTSLLGQTIDWIKKQLGLFDLWH